jgi:hypothetical protein
MSRSGARRRVALVVLSACLGGVQHDDATLFKARSD